MYDGTMAFLKKTGLYLLAQIFGLSIFGLAITFSFNSVFGKPDNIKNALKESKIYDSVADKISAEIVAQTKKDPTAQINEKELNDALNKVVTPVLLQKNGENIINGTYGWLEGKTESPEFNVDIASIQKQVTTAIADSAINRVKTLPVCTPDQIRTLQLSDYNNVDPFSLPCSVPGLNVEQLRTRFDTQIPKQEGVIGQTEFSAKDVKNNQGQNVFAEAKQITTIYQITQKLPLVFGILSLLSGIGLFFWSETRPKGVKKISKKLLFAGIGLLLIFIGSIVFLKKGLNLIPIDIVALKNSFISFIKILNNQFNTPLLFFAANFIIFGIAGLLIPKLNKHNKHPNDKKPNGSTQPVPPVTPIPNPEKIPDVPSAPKVKTKPPRLVQ